ncbi:MAG: hypothetical protein ATN32_00745 [Candidatus Epulonipiscium fishelsonii]|nr:MAG: hypothetical protein ATN32_00745 [Epulopiscium sp. AS2M-Bin002]
MLKKMLVLSITAGLVGCTTDNPDLQETTTELKKNEVIIANAAETDNGWDPIHGWGQHEPPLIQSKLVTVSGSGKLSGDLATDFEPNEDNSIWRFKLRDDVKFSDGEAFTSEDVEFTMNTIKEVSTDVDLSMVEKIEIVNEYEIRFHLTYPSSTFIYHLATIPIVPAHAYDENYRYNPIGTGPYKMVQWDIGQQRILEINELYYGEKPTIERLVFAFMNPSTALAAVQAGKVDIALADITTATNTVEGYDMLQFKTTENMGISMPFVPEQDQPNQQGYKVGNDVTSDLAIRKALSIAVDREDFAKNVLSGFGIPSFSLCSGMEWDNLDVVFEDGKIEEAKLLLETSGWIDEDGDGIREKEGLKASFDLIYPADIVLRQLTAVAFSEIGKDIGIEIKPTGMSWDEVFENWYSKANVLLVGNPTPNELHAYNTNKNLGDSFANMYYYSNDTVENYMDMAMLATTVEEANEYWRKSIWDGKTGSSMLGDCPVVWMATVDHMYFVSQDLDIGEHELHSHSSNGMQILNNVTEWKFKY